MARALPLVAAVLAAAVLGSPAPAPAAPPTNDAPGGAAAFSSYTAVNGNPDEMEAVAELAEATPDAGIARCLGPASFARTVWYRVPEGAGPQRVTVEAMGRTLDVVDLAAFVQPAVPPPPPPPPPPAEPPPEPPSPEPEPEPRARASQSPSTHQPNVCSGAGAGGAAAAEEPTSGVTLDVPAGHPVLIQAGRRGRPRAPDDERALLGLHVQALTARRAPAGDRADASTPAARFGRRTHVRLAGATVTGEDPAQPACPSLGTVWRRFTPGASGRRLIRAYGAGVETLTVFRGSRPSAGNALDCVNREGHGTLEMAVRVKKRRPVWVRIGTDTPSPTARATLQVLEGRGATVVDGGPGGADPTPGGPGGGFPAVCATARPERARISGAALRGPAGAFNGFRRIPLALVVRGASVCDVELRLYGPGRGIYARGRAVRLKGRTTVRLPRLRTFRPGRYRLAVSAVAPTGRRVPVRTRLGGRLG